MFYLAREMQQQVGFFWRRGRRKAEETERAEKAERADGDSREDRDSREDGESREARERREDEVTGKWSLSVAQFEQMVNEMHYVNVVCLFFQLLFATMQINSKRPFLK